MPATTPPRQERHRHRQRPPARQPPTLHQPLEPISSPLLAWCDFNEAFPEALVLDRDSTGCDRPYGTNPYDGYDDPDTNPFLFRGAVDDRAQAKQRVVGVNVEDAAVAWTLEAISGEGARATHGTVGDTPVGIFSKPGQASALDTAQIVDGRDVGSAAVFSPELDGRMLTFQADGDGFIDDETGSLWDITGRAVGKNSLEPNSNRSSTLIHSGLSGLRISRAAI